jgi:glucose-1-phosphate thymidylyltransferase
MPGRATAIIPVAGIGTRLRPHTHTQPKVLLHVAGKPILAHILDQLPGLGIQRSVLIVGYMGERIIEYVRHQYPRLELEFVDQPERLGLGHAVSLAEPYANDGPLLIILGDTIFEADLKRVLAGDSSSIGVKAVDDPRRFGIVEINGSGQVTRMVEKPDQPTSNLAIVGIYYFTGGGPLFAVLRELQKNNVRTRGEFQLTDGMQLLIERGERIGTFPVEGWYDCGKTETLLETNRVLLDKHPETPVVPNSLIVPPVVIAPDATVEHCILGPHVSVATGVQVKNSVVRNSILNENAVIENVLLEDSVVGENTALHGHFWHLSLGDSSQIHHM